MYYTYPCPCGSGTLFFVKQIQNKPDTFVLNHFGGHLAKHLEGAQELEAFQTSISQNIKTMHTQASKEDDSSDQLIDSISILKRTCIKIHTAENENYFIEQLFMVEDENGELLTLEQKENAEKNIDKLLHFLEQKECEATRRWRICAIQ